MLPLETRLDLWLYMQNSVDQYSYRVYLQFSASKEDSECSFIVAQQLF